MHIEKNICDNVLGTLLDIEGKTKDIVKARQDLADMKIRKELHLKSTSNSNSYLMPPSRYTLSKKERQGFCEFLKSVNFPDGYASNISRCVNVEEGKVSGLKSHDSHVMLQRLIQVGMRGYLGEDVHNTLVELGEFFKSICCKTLEMNEKAGHQKDIVLILCKLERIFPPAFFDVMVHLAIHLPREAMIGGPVAFRWMFPIERNLGSLKGYVTNRAHPEGSIAESFAVNECLTFCSMYLRQIKTKFEREERNYVVEWSKEEDEDYPFSQNVRRFGSGRLEFIKPAERHKMEWYILNNCEAVHPFYEMKGSLDVYQLCFMFCFSLVVNDRFQKVRVPFTRSAPPL